MSAPSSASVTSAETSPPPARKLTIAMVAGEASGDNLGAALIREIRQIEPHADFIGIGGPLMIEAGFTSEVDLERLSVNGFIDPLKRLPTLIKLLLRIRDLVLASGADCFVGIDFNFFNLILAGMLHRRGVKTVHYVSPTVWAWRAGRIRKIARRVDLMLTLYPHEAAIYRKHNIGVAFVGHPMAEDIAPDEGRVNKAGARAKLGYGQDDRVVAILPGSRAREVAYSGQDFLRTAEYLTDQVDRFVIPAANAGRRRQLDAMLDDYPSLTNKLDIVDGDARGVMAAADLVMVNSGTATLEAMLLKRPMIMSYRVGPFTYAIVSRMVTTRWFALPNVLAARALVPEFIQSRADPVRMAAAVTRLLQAGEHQDLLDAFDRIHHQLRTGKAPGSEAARAVLGVLVT